MRRSLDEGVVPALPPSQSRLYLGICLSLISKRIWYLNITADVGLNLFFKLSSYKMGIMVLPLLPMELRLGIVRMSTVENMSYSDTTVMGDIKKKPEIEREL